MSSSSSAPATASRSSLGGSGVAWGAGTGARTRFGLGYYGLGVRNGNCSFTGATIAHVHAHVVVGDPSRDPEVPVRMRFSSRPPQ